MVGRRVALLVATDRYQDTGLSRLAAPASDARQLAAVLRDIRIAGFEVTTLYNKPHYVAGRAIGDFYRDRRRDDLTLLYFTGHGVKDEDGRLYLAMTDTDRENLPFTGVPANRSGRRWRGPGPGRRCWSLIAATLAPSQSASASRATRRYMPLSNSEVGVAWY